MSIRLQKFSYRFAEQVLNGRLVLKEEVEQLLVSCNDQIASCSRPGFNKLLDEKFVAHGWHRQPAVFDEVGDPGAKMDFLKDRVGVEVGFGHASFMGIDLLKFQVASYSALDKIDVGIYIMTTANFQKEVKIKFNQNWEGSLSFEKVKKYLPHFKSAIQVPIYVVGIDL
jgi:Restriction endonuclease BglII